MGGYREKHGELAEKILLAILPTATNNQPDKALLFTRALAHVAWQFAESFHDVGVEREDFSDVDDPAELTKKVLEEMMK